MHTYVDTHPPPLTHTHTRTHTNARAHPHTYVRDGVILVPYSQSTCWMHLLIEEGAELGIACRWKSGKGKWKRREWLMSIKPHPISKLKYVTDHSSLHSTSHESILLYLLREWRRSRGRGRDRSSRRQRSELMPRPCCVL